MAAPESPSTEKPSGLTRLLPILQWGPRYDRSWLRGDLVAGLAVAALVVPKSLGYAGIAGVPIQHGLYAAAAGAIIYALFGTCRQKGASPGAKRLPADSPSHRPARELPIVAMKRPPDGSPKGMIRIGRR